MWPFNILKRRRKKKRTASRPRGEPRLTGGRDREKSSSGETPRKKKRSATSHTRKWIGFLVKRASLPLLVIVLAGVGYICHDLPDISRLGDIKKAPSIVVKAEDGTVLGTYGDIYGDYVPYDELPKSLINAVVATEDRNFFHHFGIDPMGILRAMFVNIRARHWVQGGSTITQQLAKNAFLTQEKKLKRKLQEMVLAVELEHHFTKQQILTIYLNRVYMGAGNYGVDAASRRYFGHSVRTLTLPESAILVGLLKAPTRYAPTNNPDRSEKRATQVLLNMVAAGYLTQAQADAAKSQFDDEDAVYRDSHGFGAFYFSDWVVGQLPQYINDTQSDLIVTTTLNPQWQQTAEDAVDDVLAAKGKTMKASQAALLSMSPDGAIRAMVGGRNYRASQFNRVTQAMRQPGSSFKLFVYLAALEAGYTPDSQMEDRPINVGNWHPRDYTGKYKGTMTLRDAFADSINSIAVQLSEAVGRSKVAAMAQRLGITTDIELDPSIALGTTEVTLFDMTDAYAHLASGGNSVYPYAITKVETPGGQVLYQHGGSGGGQVLRPPIVGMMNNMLLAVTQYGTGRGATIGRPVAGKTGTTSDYRDAWFIGFTPQLVTGVWVGNDDTSPMKKVTGGNLPASIWHNYMMAALKGLPVEQIPNQSAATSGGGGYLPWLFPSQAAAPVAPQPQQPQQPFTPPPGTPRQMQPAPLAPPSHQPPSNQPTVAPMAPDTNQDMPEDAPPPEYNAPPSFWDKLR
jgi:penicillin-binding protein 1A